jgi:adenosylhomocysteine nucleosidase
MIAPRILVCFALSEEAAPFRQFAAVHPGLRIVITGMGCKNSERSARAVLTELPKPDLVLTCGFAGALNPALALGTVVFALSPVGRATSLSPQAAAPGDRRVAAPGLMDGEHGAGAMSPSLVRLKSQLLDAGACESRFHCADRVAVTAAEKRALWQTTGADAVEMESEIITCLCREHGIPSATVRVISDTAGEDLPLDFNLLLTSDQHMDYAKLATAILKSPGKIAALRRLQQHTRHAAARLAEALSRTVG